LHFAVALRVDKIEILEEPTNDEIERCLWEAGRKFEASCEQLGPVIDACWKSAGLPVAGALQELAEHIERLIGNYIADFRDCMRARMISESQTAGKIPALTSGASGADLQPRNELANASMRRRLWRSETVAAPHECGTSRRLPAKSRLQRLLSCKENAAPTANR
jgi:hypothetical protein